MHFLTLVLGWWSFVIAAVNLIRASYDYALDKPGATGAWGAISRSLIVGFCFAAWWAALTIK